MRNDQQSDAMDVRTERRANQALSASALVSQSSPVQVERTEIVNIIGSAGVSSVAGTANQIIASSSTGAITLSTPQSIGTGSSPTFADLILSAPTHIEYAFPPFVFNLNNAAAQTLYTVPVGKSGCITKVLARSPSGNLSTGLTTNLNFGFDVGASNWSPGGGMQTPDLTSTGMFKVFDQFTASGGVGVPFGVAGGTFKAIVDAAFGSAATLVLVPFGVLF